MRLHVRVQDSDGMRRTIAVEHGGPPHAAGLAAVEEATRVYGDCGWRYWDVQDARGNVLLESFAAHYRRVRLARAAKRAV